MRNLSFLILLFSIACTETTNVSQWRGENRDGIYEETNLLKTWPKEGPQVLWESEEIGFGYGAPTVTASKVYVNGEIDSVSHLFAFNLDGTLNWKAENGKEFMGKGFSASFPGARSTPTVIDSFVYAISGIGRVACFDTETGNEIWARDMKNEFSGIPSIFGYAESPLVDGDKLFCLPAGKDSNVVALNRFTGENIWISKALSDTASYCSPMLINLPNRNIYVNFTIHNIFGLDAETGELLWSQKQKITKYNQPSNTPIYKDGFLYYLASDGNGAVKLALSENGESIEEVWAHDTKAGTFNGFLIKDGKMYNTTRKVKMEIRDTESGNLIDSLRIKTGTLLFADDMIYGYSNNGSINLININDSINIVSKFKIKKGSKEHFSTPVIRDGVLYARHGNYIAAFKIREE